MVLFSIILTVVIAVGVISFKAQITDSADTEPSAGCAGLLLLAAAFIAILVLATREFGHNPRTLLFVVLPIGAIVAALYSPFITSVFSSFFERVLFPSGGGEIKRHDIAQKLTSEGRYSEAVAEYQKAIEADPEDVNARVLIADVYCRMDQYEQAARTLLEALEQDLPAEKWCPIANRLADIFVQKMSEPHEAVQVLKRILEKYPKTKSARYARERIARISGS